MQTEDKSKKVRFGDLNINCGTLTVMDEDHTFGNVMRMQLLKDRIVKFAGYRRPHPLEAKVEVKIQTTGEKTPTQCINDASQEVLNHIGSLEMKFKDAMAVYKGEAAPLPMGADMQGVTHF